MVSGIILDFFGYDKNIVKSLVESSIPSVIFGLNVEADISCVQTDDTTGAREAVDYGIRMGYKISFISAGTGAIYSICAVPIPSERDCRIAECPMRIA